MDGCPSLSLARDADPGRVDPSPDPNFKKKSDPVIKEGWSNWQIKDKNLPFNMTIKGKVVIIKS